MSCRQFNARKNNNGAEEYEEVEWKKVKAKAMECTNKGQATTNTVIWSTCTTRIFF